MSETTFDKPAFGGDSRPVPSIKQHPARIQPGHAARGVQDLRALAVSRVRLKRSANQNIANNPVNDVEVSFDVIERDTDGYTSIGSAARPTIRHTAEYFVDFTAIFEPSGAGFRRATVELSTDGGATFNGIQQLVDGRNSVGGGRPDRLHGCGHVYLNRGDRLRLTVFQDSGAAINLTEAELQIRYSSPS